MSVSGRTVPLTRNAVRERLTERVCEVIREPEYSWSDRFRSFMTDPDGRPAVRVALADCTLDTDIWQGLRSPAQVGLYPVGLADIWAHYAAANVPSTRPDGSPNYLAMPETFDEAKKRFRRAVILSAMLAINPQVLEAFAEKLDRGEEGPLDLYGRARSEISNIINRALDRLALSLLAAGRAVVPMTGKNVDNIINGTRSEYLKGRYHGPCNNHYPQNSIAVMTGLMRFGISRLPFRDELGPHGATRRLFGRYASIVIFDEQEPVADGTDGVTVIDAERLARLRRVNDYTVVAPEVVAERYCTYNLLKADGSSVCGKCLEFCGSDALENSSPRPDGTFDEKLASQKHRFSNDTLDFDFGNCSRYRSQKAQLYAEFVCGRCEAVCAARGIRKPAEDVARINGT